MSVFSFSPPGGPILVKARATGPAQSSDLVLMLDTGSTSTVIDLSILISLGFDPDRDGRPVQVTTASSVAYSTKVTLTRLFAQGQNRIGFPVVAHSLPAGVTVDGLLGLDFVRGPCSDAGLSGRDDHPGLT